MTDKIVFFEEDSDDSTKLLTHHGIKGMKWGVRRKRGSDGRVGSNQKSARDISRDLRKQKRAKIRARNDATYDEQVRRERALEKGPYKKLDKALTKELAAIDAGPGKSKLLKAFKKMKAREVVDTKKIKLYDEMETKLWKENRALRKERNRKKIDAAAKLDTELSTQWRNLYDSKVKGKGLISGLKAFREMEKEFDAIAEVRWAELELEYA